MQKKKMSTALIVTLCVLGFGFLSAVIYSIAVLGITFSEIG